MQLLYQNQIQFCPCPSFAQYQSKLTHNGSCCSPDTDPDADTQAFLVSNGEYAVLAFRGTEVSKKIDITTDVNAGKASLIEGNVHKGFTHAYKSIEDQVMAGLKKIGDLPLYITGHSLGAALATVAT